MSHMQLTQFVKFVTRLITYYISIQNVYSHQHSVNKLLLYFWWDW